MPAVLAVGAGRFFRLFIGHCSLQQMLEYLSPEFKCREKIFQQWLQAIAFSPFPNLLHRKDSPAPAALAAGAGHFFLPFPFLIQLRPLIPLIMIGMKMPSLETIQYNMIKKKIRPCSSVSWFSICS